MKNILTAAALISLFVFIGCDSNPLYFRLASDYFPVSPSGATWEYSIESGGSRIVTVVDQTVMGERPCWRLQSGADYEYYINDEGKLERFENQTILFNGFEVPIYQGWVTMYQWPLADGMVTRDSVGAQTVSQGVTLSHSWVRTQTVDGPVVSPDGSWSECYRIHREETSINWIQTAGFDPETIVVVSDIWLAPDLGMVAMESGETVLTLTSFTTGGE